jgi:hypothetical protein
MRLDRALDIATNLLEEYYRENKHEVDEKEYLLEISQAIPTLYKLYDIMADLAPLLVTIDSDTDS